MLIPFLWAGDSENGYHKVWIIETDYIEWCNGAAAPRGLHTFSGCYKQLDDITFQIEIKTGHMFKLDTWGCNTILEHEFYHAMGKDHGESPLSLC